jgi:hypothetical protein
VGITSSSGIRSQVAADNPTRGLLAQVYNFGGATRTGSQMLFTQAGVADWAIGQPANTNAFAFYYGRNATTDGTEAARFDSSGNLLVGTTSDTTGIVNALQSANKATYFAKNTNATGAVGYQLQYTTSFNNTSNEAFYYADGAQRFAVRSNGGIANFQANDANLSDRREKTNFAPAKSYLDVICSIPVQTFNYIDQNLKEDSGLTLGVVAQDVQAVAPELVTESNWGTKEDPKMRLSIYQTDLQYALMKALQELKSEFDAYKASHP